MDAPALRHSSTAKRGLLSRRSRVLRLQGDERLIAMMREGHERAFEVLVDRYQARLLAFCRGMLASSEDAEDVLQEVFVAAHKAILADNRAINARPWLYRIARNRCLNHLRKPVPEGQDSMDVLPHENGTSVAEKVEKRAEFRALLGDVQELPETQRTALLLREIDALAYEDIAVAMETTVPAVKSLLVRARMSLADSTQGRHLTCDEVHLELAEAVEGLRKASGPARAHMKNCERCRQYRKELRRNGKALSALAPVGILAGLQHAFALKVGFGAKAGTGAGAATGAGAGTGAVGAGSGLGLAGSSAAGIGSIAVGAKAAAGVAASMALITAGAVEVNRIANGDSGARPLSAEQPQTAMVAKGPGQQSHTALRAPQAQAMIAGPVGDTDQGEEPETSSAPPPEEPPAEPVAPEEPAPTAPVDPVAPAEPTDSAGTGDTSGGSGTGTVDPANPGDSDGVITPPGEEPEPLPEPPVAPAPPDGFNPAP